jgi:hypothetical protein
MKRKAAPTTKSRVGATEKSTEQRQSVIDKTTESLVVLTTSQDDVQQDAPENNGQIQSATVWQQSGWTARVQKNEDDDGWAVAMTMDGESEPTLVGPWTMGRDKKNPKPLDTSAFTTLVKTANEIVRRHQQQAHAALHRSTKVATARGRVRVALDIVPDEDNPHAILSAFDDEGGELASMQVPANFKFNHEVASAWVQGKFAKVGGDAD